MVPTLFPSQLYGLLLGSLITPLVQLVLPIYVCVDGYPLRTRETYQ